jgi:hypothetical protein
MPTPLKIDPIELNKMLDEEKTTKEIAEYFGCSHGAVSHAKKRLATAIVAYSSKRYDASITAAPLIIKNTDDAKQQISSLISRCNDELAWIRDSVDQRPDSEYREWQQTAIKHVAEIRKLISTLADIEYKLHHVEIVEKALLTMFQEIGHESPECQKRIRDRLERAQILFFMDD